MMMMMILMMMLMRMMMMMMMMTMMVLAPPTATATVLLLLLGHLASPFVHLLDVHNSTPTPPRSVDITTSVPLGPYNIGSVCVYRTKSFRMRLASLGHLASPFVHLWDVHAQAAAVSRLVTMRLCRTGSRGAHVPHFTWADSKSIVYSICA
jgi:hypothetical protein